MHTWRHGGLLPDPFRVRDLVELCTWRDPWHALLGSEPIAFHDRAHFFAIAAQTMRPILIDHARARVAEKRGGAQQRVSLSVVDDWNPVERDEDVLALDESLTKLEKNDPRAARARGSHTSITFAMACR